MANGTGLVAPSAFGPGGLGGSLECPFPLLADIGRLGPRHDRIQIGLGETASFPSVAELTASNWWGMGAAR